MDRFFAPHSPEAVAHHHLSSVHFLLCFVAAYILIFFRSENVFSWDTEHPDLNENNVAGFASYQAFTRYLGGADLYLLPRSRSELEAVLYVTSGPTSDSPQLKLTIASLTPPGGDTRTMPFIT